MFYGVENMIAGVVEYDSMCDDCGRKYRMPSDSLDVDYACSERPMGISC